MYNLFRQLGLRHIFVVPRPSRVVGLITRKDLLLEVISDTFSFVEKYIFSLSGLSSKSYVVSGGWQYCDGGAPIDECKVLMFLLPPKYCLHLQTCTLPQGTYILFAFASTLRFKIPGCY